MRVNLVNNEPEYIYFILMHHESEQRNGQLGTIMLFVMIIAKKSDHLLYGHKIRYILCNNI